MVATDPTLQLSMLRRGVSGAVGEGGGVSEVVVVVDELRKVDGLLGLGER